MNSIFSRIRLFMALSFFLIPTVDAVEAVAVGAGSYLRGLPEGAKGPPDTIYRAIDNSGAMPTSDWWSSLAWVPFSHAMYPHPLAIKANERGLRISYPGPGITANKAAIFGFMGGGSDDLVIGHSEIETFTEARVAGWSDWFVTTEMGEPSRSMRLTFGHGSPFVFVLFAGGEPVITFAKPPIVFAGKPNDAVLGVRVGSRSYGLFAPANSSWTGLGTARFTAATHGKPHFSVAVLPDDTPATLELFQRHAYAHVADTRVSWSYDEKGAAVGTTFSFATHAHEGAETNTLFALYPHQWRAADADFTDHTYASVRGPMKLARGSGFHTSMILPPALPSLPLTVGTDRKKLRELLASDLAGKPPQIGDTYWLGKQLGKWATLIPLAELADDTESVAECDRRIRDALERFFTATTSGETTKKARDGVFAYEPKWGTLIGYPASYGSDADLNDHHFHYGYFLRAAGEIARRDPKWAVKWSGMLKLLVRDIASPDRNDAMFPFLRRFDPYAGHSWASGHAKFGDGNNNESSSEAANAWFGLMLLGEATGDTRLRNLGAWLFTTEVAAIEDYWFDVRDELHPSDYPVSVVTMVWGGKGANGTWFSGNPECIHGINFLPITGGSLYLGRWPEYVRRNYASLLRENVEWDARNAKRKNQPPPSHDGTAFDQWEDLIWMFRALSDPSDARRMWEGRPAGFKPESGNSLAQTYAWISAINDLGTVERSVTGDTPFAATFLQKGKRTHVVWNLAAAERTVTFSDGTTLKCAPRSITQD